MKNINIIFKYSSERECDKGESIEFKYKVLEEGKIENLEIGHDIEIKEFNGSSILKDLKPYEFSFWIFLLIPIPLLIIGLPFLFYSIFNLKKEIKLYKFGKVSKGEIISMIPKAGLPVSNVDQGIIVHYEYETSNKNKQVGESFTDDFSIINDKKRNDFVPIFISTENENKSCVIPKLQSLRNNWKIEFE